MWKLNLSECCDPACYERFVCRHGVIRMKTKTRTEMPDVERELGKRNFPLACIDCYYEYECNDPSKYRKECEAWRSFDNQ